MDSLFKGVNVNPFSGDQTNSLFEGVNVNPFAQPQEQTQPQAQKPFDFNNAKPEDMITMVDPTTKKIVDVPRVEYDLAIKNGYVEASKQQTKNAKLINEMKGFEGDFYAGIYGAFDEGTFGIGKAILKAIDPHIVERAEAIADDHVVSQYVGRAAGIALGAAVTSGTGVGAKITQLGERAAAGVSRTLATSAEKAIAAELVSTTAGMSVKSAEKLAAPIYKYMASQAAQYGAEGLAYAAPKAATEAIFGNYEEAAESLAYGMVGGAVLGGAIGGVSSAGSKASRKLSQLAGDIKLSESASDFVGKQADHIMLRNIGHQKSTLNKVGYDNAVDALHYLQNTGHIVNGYQSQEKLHEGIVKAGNEAVDMMTSSIGKLDSNLDKLAKAEIQDGANSLLDDLYKLRDKVKFKEGVGRNEVKFIDEGIDMIEKSIPDITNYDSAWSLRKRLDEFIKYDQSDSKSLAAFKNQVKQDVRNVYSKGLEKNIELASKTLNDPSIIENWKNGNKLFSSAAKLIPGIENLEKREAGNRMFGLTDNIMLASGANSALNSIENVADKGIGSVAKSLIPFAVKKAAETTQIQTSLAGALYKLQKLGGKKLAGLTLTAEAQDQTSKQLSRIPGILEALKTNTKQSVSQKIGSGLGNYIGIDVSKHTTYERKREIQALNEKLNTLTPDELSDKLSMLTSPLAEAGAPKIGDALVMQQMRTIDYIKSIIPQNTAPTGGIANPFEKPSYNITDQALHKFESQMEVIDNPFSVFDNLENNTLTHDQVETLKTIYPTLYTAIVSEIQSQAMSRSEVDPDSMAMDYNKRIKLSLLLGQNFDSSLDHVAAFQNTFKNASQPNPPKSKLDLIGKTNPYATDSQRIAAKA